MMNPADPDNARHSSTGHTIAGRYNGDKRNNTYSVVLTIVAGLGRYSSRLSGTP
jgi:hypothetical protein